MKLAQSCMKGTLALVGLFITAGTTPAATLIWEAIDPADAQPGGLGLADGTDLPVGSLLRVGTFTIDAPMIRSNSGNLSFLNANFLEFGSSAIGSGGLDIPAHWSQSSSGPTDPGFVGERIFIWAFNSTTLATATQHGIFSAADPDWEFRSDSPTPWSGTIDLSEVQNDPAQIIIGGVGLGTSDATGDPLYNLAIIPEPTSQAVVGGLACLIGAALWRFRRTGQK